MRHTRLCSGLIESVVNHHSLSCSGDHRWWQGSILCWVCANMHLSWTFFLKELKSYSNDLSIYYKTLCLPISPICLFFEVHWAIEVIFCCDQENKTGIKVILKFLYLTFVHLTWYFIYYFYILSIQNLMIEAWWFSIMKRMALSFYLHSCLSLWLTLRRSRAHHIHFPQIIWAIPLSFIL